MSSTAGLLSPSRPLPHRKPLARYGAMGARFASGLLPCYTTTVGMIISVSSGQDGNSDAMTCGQNRRCAQVEASQFG